MNLWSGKKRKGHNSATWSLPHWSEVLRVLRESADYPLISVDYCPWCDAIYNSWHDIIYYSVTEKCLLLSSHSTLHPCLNLPWYDLYHGPDIKLNYQSATHFLLAILLKLGYCQSTTSRLRTSVAIYSAMYLSTYILIHLNCLVDLFGSTIIIGTWVERGGSLVPRHINQLQQQRRRQENTHILIGGEFRCNQIRVESS